MSGAFTPVVLNKETTRTAFKTVASAIISSPVALVMALAVAIAMILIMAWLWQLPGEATVAMQVISAMLFMLFTVNWPPLVGSYLMYKAACRHSLSDFIGNVSATGYGRYFIYSQIANMVIFTIMFSLGNAMSSSGEAAGSDSSANGDELLIFFVFNVLLLPVAVFFWLKLVNEQSIKLRTGFDENQTVHYGKQARIMNKKGVSVTVAIMSLFIFIVFMLAPSFLFVTSLFFIAMLIGVMVWIYVLFGNTFPPKEKAKSTVLKPITQNQ